MIQAGVGDEVYIAVTKKKYTKMWFYLDDGIRDDFYFLTSSFCDFVVVANQKILNLKISFLITTYASRKLKKKKISI